MSYTIGTNHTPYATEDLQDILDLLHVATRRGELEYRWAANPPEVLTVHLAAENIVPVSLLHKSDWSNKMKHRFYSLGIRPPFLVHMGDTHLNIAPPFKIEAAFLSEALANLGGTPRLPGKVVADIVVCLASHMMGVSYLGMFLNNATLTGKAAWDELVSAAIERGVRILPSVVDKKQVRKLLLEEKLKNVVGGYGKGGVLPTCKTWNQGYFDGLRHAYETEWKRREVYRKRAAKLGIELPPYETLLQFLERKLGEL